MKKKILALAFSFMFILGISAVFIGCTPEKEYYTLTVNYNNDIDKQTELSVEKGTTIVSLGSSTALLMENSPIVVLPSSQNISSPHKLLVFDGWYTNSTFTEKFDTSKPIEEDTSIIAKWKLNEEYSFFQIASGSMQASGFNTGDIIICKNLTALDSVNVGDFILYNYSSLTVFHHVV
ncbi:MAG: InlB B-repeat-containing protein [Clostridia bacterium]|nr:InlB B-repeat-containing protein [Clostridia bacterium]